MTRIATMGTSSCATIAIAGFKDEQKELNESYRKDPKSFKLEGKSVDQFYNDILYPISQPLGSTGEYPFDLLMEELNRSGMKDKFIIATLNSYQFFGGYFTELLLNNGFSLVDKTKNNIGEMCYIFIRNEARKGFTNWDNKIVSKYSKNVPIALQVEDIVDDVEEEFDNGDS